MLRSYSDVFNCEVGGELLMRLVEEEAGLVRVEVKTLWRDPIQTHSILIRVPIARQSRFPWDDDLFGYTLQMIGGATRFCHPRLRSKMAEDLAANGDLHSLSRFHDLKFYWESWYDRLNSAIQEAFDTMASSRQQPGFSFVATRLQRAVNQLLAGARGRKGLPITDPAMILRQKFEVELGYPNCLRDNELFEAIKHRFLTHVDNMCDITFTGKHDVGRFPMRVHPDDPKSHVTKRPMTRFAMAVWAMSPYGNPTRVFREARSLPMCRYLEEPTDPPLRIEGYQLPPELAARVTTVMVAICDIPGMNVFVAGDDEAEQFGVEVGEVSCLDALLVTPTGRKRLRAKERRSRTLTEEGYSRIQPKLERLSDVQVREIRNLVEVMGDGAPVWEVTYQIAHAHPLPCGYDKVKAPSGVKGVTRPIHQLYTRIGDAIVPIDLVIAEKTVLSKGARDLALGALLPIAGLTTIDPSQKFEDLCQLAEEGLEHQGFPTSGRFPILVKNAVPHTTLGPVDIEQAEGLKALGAEIRWTVEYVQIGEGVVGPIPVSRAAETEERQSSADTGVAVNVEARNLVGVPFPFEDGTKAEVRQISGFFMRHCSI